jgi:hypothetical protein
MKGEQFFTNKRRGSYSSRSKEGEAIFHEQRKWELFIMNKECGFYFSSRTKEVGARVFVTNKGKRRSNFS